MREEVKPPARVAARCRSAAADAKMRGRAAGASGGDGDCQESAEAEGSSLKQGEGGDGWNGEGAAEVGFRPRSRSSCASAGVCGASLRSRFCRYSPAEARTLLNQLFASASVSFVSPEAQQSAEEASSPHAAAPSHSGATSSSPRAPENGPLSAWSRCPASAPPPRPAVISWAPASPPSSALRPLPAESTSSSPAFSLPPPSCSSKASPAVERARPWGVPCGSLSSAAETASLSSDLLSHAHSPLAPPQVSASRTTEAEFLQPRREGEAKARESDRRDCGGGAACADDGEASDDPQILIVIVAYRDRKEQLAQWLPCLISYLQAVCNLERRPHYEPKCAIVFAEQADAGAFNKGALLNAAVAWIFQNLSQLDLALASARPSSDRRRRASSSISSLSSAACPPQSPPCRPVSVAAALAPAASSSPPPRRSCEDAREAMEKRRSQEGLSGATQGMQHVSADTVEAFARRAGGDERQEKRERDAHAESPEKKRKQAPGLPAESLRCREALKETAEGEKSSIERKPSRERDNDGGKRAPDETRQAGDPLSSFSKRLREAGRHFFFCFHDVDVVPKGRYDDFLFRDSRPCAYFPAPPPGCVHQLYGHRWCLGGVLVLRCTDFLRAGGWGYEDDDFLARCLHSGLWVDQSTLPGVFPARLDRRAGAAGGPQGRGLSQGFAAAAAESLDQGARWRGDEAEAGAPPCACGCFSERLSPWSAFRELDRKSAQAMENEQRKKMQSAAAAANKKLFFHAWRLTEETENEASQGDLSARGDPRAPPAARCSDAEGHAEGGSAPTLDTPASSADSKCEEARELDADAERANGAQESEAMQEIAQLQPARDADASEAKRGGGAEMNTAEPRSEEAAEIHVEDGLDAVLHAWLVQKTISIAPRPHAFAEFLPILPRYGEAGAEEAGEFDTAESERLAESDQREEVAEQGDSQSTCDWFIPRDTAKAIPLLWVRVELNEAFRNPFS